jgi:hypothetical protein
VKAIKKQFLANFNNNAVFLTAQQLRVIERIFAD